MQAIRSYCSLRFPGLELAELSNLGMLSESQLKELLNRIYAASGTEELEAIFQPAFSRLRKNDRIGKTWISVDGL